MDVRQVRPTDAPLVLSLSLDDSAHLVKAHGWTTRNPVVRSLARTALPLPLPGRSWLARDGDSIALLEAQPRQYVIAWDVTRCAVRGDANFVLPPVVGAAIEHLQSRGVPRLFARCDSDGAEVLAGVEFHALAREFVLLGPEGTSDSDTSLPIDSRYRIPPDAWPLHQLEVETTPSLVRQVEGVTSLDWSQPSREMSEIVVERNGEIVAWIGWGGKTRHGLLAIHLLLRANHSRLGPDLVHFALKNLPPGVRYVARVREYAPEALRAFTDRGFTVVGEETVMVKHAGMERARAISSRLRVANVPSIQGFPFCATPVEISPAAAKPKRQFLRLMNRDRIA